jgi:hypothetical protein
MPKRGDLDPNASERSKYQREYNSKPSSKKDRASRNQARAEAIKDGRVKKGSNSDVDHKNSDPRDNKKSNTQVISKSKNRAMNQHDKRKK